MKNRCKILFCFHKLKKGGGQNVALNFLQGVEKLKFDLNNHEFLVVEDSVIHHRLVDLGARNLHFAPSNPFFSIVWEAIFSLLSLRLLKVNVVYTYFGFSNFFFCDLPQVSGSADSNLYYPEIDFWEGESGLASIKKKCIDRYRIYGIKKSRAVIFENKALMDQGKRLFKLSEIKLIMPSISRYGISTSSSRTYGIEGKINLLFLCGWQRNKGILIIPNLIALAKKRNLQIHVTLTAGKSNCSLSTNFMAKAKALGVEDSISIIDSVTKLELPALYKDMDVVMLLSKLESFSNNIIEAWNFNKPLIVAEEPWARSICNQGAIYVDRTSSSSIIEAILELQNLSVRKMVCKQGELEINKYPTIEMKTKLELDYIYYVSKIN
jgi:glycosyltransferase involved in cell wall biosynthesis